MEAEEFRRMVGILKKDEVRTYIIPDGEMKTFGKQLAMVDEHIDMEDVDDQQFAIRNFDGNLYLICMSTS